MAQIHRAAVQASMARLWADVSLCAERFFNRSGFGVDALHQVQVRGMLLANARMAKRLQAPETPLVARCACSISAMLF